MTDAFNAANRKDVREAEKRAKQKERLNAEVVSSLMSHTAGREWMHDLLASCGVFDTTLVIGSTDATAFNEGRRSVGLQFTADVMRIAPDQYVTMMREHNEREQADASRRSKRDRDDGDDEATADERELEPEPAG